MSRPWFNNYIFISEMLYLNKNIRKNIFFIKEICCIIQECRLFIKVQFLIFGINKPVNRCNVDFAYFVKFEMPFKIELL